MSRLDSIVDGSATEQVAPKIVCADGFTVSVQASWGHYALGSNGKRPDYRLARGVPCDRNGDVLPYTALEVGYPSERPEPWYCTAWADGYDSHDNHPVCDGWEAYGDEGEGIYAFVPVQMVRDLIALHGGEK